jgi:ABC-type nitrate/sulfonate/bicarbonate transport system ATPase subunit
MNDVDVVVPQTTMNNEQMIISIRDLNHTFDRNLLAKAVLCDINLDIDRSEMVILTGHSGRFISSLVQINKRDIYRGI